ncbi:MULTISPECIES: hypothetical protein [unclassified Thalassospira]|uniref:hypothetical protein n=1 Tax=unclassified Thalassospira TaxID=2648997 RepID=UPI0007A9F719|nr:MULTISPECIES: hypothetical protein [unclassified Thalassospira]KZD01394.1 hypothetical protein AUQ41_19580 [Thalassospira sp. MCCC 1A02898]ONH88384.1 hypothetical protein TH47_11510 [Thalassospira sp. MCCC 1A02803]
MLEIIGKSAICGSFVKVGIFSKYAVKDPSMWDKNGYLAKFKRYWARANSSSRQAIEFRLYLSFCSEFLVRAALVHKSPVLNASVDEASLRFGGGIPGAGNERSVKLETAIARLKLLVPNLNDEEHKALVAVSAFRNTELHSDKDGFLGDQLETIKPSILSAFVKIAEFMDENLEDILGKREADQAREISKQISIKKKRRTVDLIKIEKERFFSQSQEEIDKARGEAEFQFEYMISTKGQHVWVDKCPACSSRALIYGHPIGHGEPFLRNEEVVQEVRVQPDGLNCRCCNLKLKGLDEMIAANFKHEYTHIDALDPLEFHGIDPMEHVDIDKIIQDYEEDREAQYLSWRDL